MLTKTLLAAAVTGILAGSLAGCANNEPKPATDPTSSSVTEAPKAMGTAAGPIEKHACKGKNSCKGNGGCKTDKNACKGQNSCKGQGGCNTQG